MTIDTAAKSQSGGHVFGIPLEKLHLFVNGAYLIALALTVLLSFAIFLISNWISAEKDRELRHFQVSAEQRIADAKAEAAKANLKAAELALEAQKLREQMQWRRLSARQRAILIEKLKDHSFEVWVATVRNEPEANLFHQEIYDALQAAGLKPKWFEGYARAIGLTISAHGFPEEDILTDAFAAAGIPLSPDAPGSQKMPGNIPQITVGSKPPPF